MRLLLLLALFGLAMIATATPISPEDEERPSSLLDLADAGGSHSIGADRLVRHWGGGYGGWGGGGWGGGGWGGGGWGGGRWGGGWGGGRWGGGWGGGRWGGGWGGGGWGGHWG